MIDDARRDEAADYVMDLLDPVEAERFRAEMRRNPELERAVIGLENAAAKLAYAAPLHRPPPGLKSRIMAQIGVIPARQANRTAGAWVPWAMAAALAVAALLLFRENAGSRGQIAALLEEMAASESAKRESGRLLAEMEAERTREIAGIRQERDTLKQRDAMAAMKIATLKAQVSAYEKVFAVIVWDATAQQGLVKLGQFPVAGEGKDYQLWVIDPNRPVPVSAGVVPVSADGTAQIEFAPELAISSADAFAISIEQKGGSPAPAGEIVVLGK